MVRPDNTEIMTIHEIVNKLIGATAPTGCHEIDQDRRENLAVKIELAHNLVAEIYEISEDKGSHMASVSNMGREAEEGLKSLADYLPSNAED